MRVLAIRGRNLASLAGDFAVDFEAEPLADAGIFAITGPTGAGKSTLLDAVCLALFNEIPRLSAAPTGARISVGGQEDGITASDPRLILRHGTGEGFAEVDFATANGARYRATWAVKRARGLSSGKLQNVQQSFQRLDTGEILGGTRTETLAAIRDAVGLSAEQFGRAVLLAQGEFEAFIRAKPDERAVLLERLTGSEIYARLGKKAYAKAQELRRGIDSLRALITNQDGLDETQRTQAEADLTEAHMHEANAAQHVAALNTGIEWEKRAAALVIVLNDAIAKEAAALADVDASQPRRAALAQDRKAMALAPALTARDGAGMAIEAALGLIAKNEADLTLAKAHEEQAQRAEQGAQTTLAEARKAAQAMGPEIANARALDLQISDAAKRLTEAEAQASGHAGKLKAAAQVEADAAQSAKTAEAQLQLHADWLAANSALSPLIPRKGELLGALASQADNSALLHALNSKADQADKERLTALTAWNDAGETLGKAIADHDAAAQNLAAIDVPHPTRLGEIAALRDKLSSLTGSLVNFISEDQTAREFEGALASARSSHAEAQTAIAKTREEDQVLAARQPGLEGRRDEANRACKLAEAAADQAAQALREQLVDGEPCPVCGATEHRLSALDAVLGEHLVNQRARLAELEGELTALIARRGELASDLKVAEAHAANIAGEIAKLGPQLAEKSALAAKLAASVAGEAAALGLAAESAELSPTLAQRIQQADAELASLTAAQTRAEDARKAEQASRAALDTARTAHTEAQNALTHRNRAAEHITNEAKGLNAAIAQTEGLIDAALSALLDWRAEKQPAHWLSAKIDEWHAHEAGQTNTARSLAGLREALAQAANDLSAIKAVSENSTTTASRERDDRDRLAAERAHLLAGEAVAAVEERLNGAINYAETALSVATQARAEAAKAIVAVQTQLEGARTRQEEEQAKLAQTSEAFAAALEVAKLAEADVRRVADGGQAALDAENEALTGLDQTLAQQRAVLAKCHEDIARHEASEAPALRGDELASAVAEAEHARNEATKIRSAIEVRLQMDDAVRAKTASLRADLIRAEAAADVWLRLDHLVGDATGNKFRRFAQGLTLDSLLEHANARLLDLKPRFTLERATGGDMLIHVIDNDMAGDVRGLHNLSGGERFLVSLALALGLAEMSTAKGVQIESLFIDEGFGALDPKSLGDAIAVLEHLHATGRRVGVISHVEDLKERIPVKIEVTPAAPGRSTLTVTMD